MAHRSNRNNELNEEKTPWLTLFINTFFFLFGYSILLPFHIINSTTNSEDIKAMDDIEDIVDEIGDIMTLNYMADGYIFGISSENRSCASTLYSLCKRNRTIIIFWWHPWWKEIK